MNAEATLFSRVLLLAASTALTLPACDDASGGESPSVTGSCGAKCDDGSMAPADAEVALIESIEITELLWDEDEGEAVSFRLLAEVSPPHADDVFAGHTLDVELYVPSEPDRGFIEAELVYDEEHVGAFVTDTIPLSQVAGFAELSVRVNGEHEGRAVAQEFRLDERNAGYVVQPFIRGSLGVSDDDTYSFMLTADSRTLDGLDPSAEFDVEVRTFPTPREDAVLTATAVRWSNDLWGLEGLDLSSLAPATGVEFRVRGDFGIDTVDQTFAFEVALD